jgi:hypothetical protein
MRFNSCHLAGISRSWASTVQRYRFYVLRCCTLPSVYLFASLICLYCTICAVQRLWGSADPSYVKTPDFVSTTLVPEYPPTLFLSSVVIAVPWTHAMSAASTSCYSFVEPVAALLSLYADAQLWIGRSERADNHAILEWDKWKTSSPSCLYNCWTCLGAEFEARLCQLHYTFCTQYLYSLAGVSLALYQIFV